MADPSLTLRGRTPASQGDIRLHAERIPTSSLVAIHRRLLEARTTDDIMNATADGAELDVGADAAIVLLLDGDRVKRVANRGFPPELADAHVGRTLPTPSPLADAVRERRALFFADLAAFHERYPTLDATSGLFRAHASLPLDGDGGTFGELFLSWREPRAFAKQDEAVLESFAALVAQALWRARLLEEREAAASTLRARDTFLTDATLQLLERALDPDETLRLIARLTTQQLASFCSVDLLDGPARLRRVIVAHAEPAKAPLVARLLREFPPDPTLRVIVERIPRGEALVHNELSREHLAAFVRSPEEARLMDALDLRHTMLVPLVGRSGLLGALGLSRTSAGEPFGSEDVFVAKSLATRAALAFESAQLHRETSLLEAQWRRLYERHQRILDTAPVQVLTIDEDGRILSINRSVRGAETKTALDLNAFDTIVPEDRDRVRSVILDAVRTGRITEYETQALLDGGVTRWFHVRVGPLELEDGARGAVLVSTDIEERKTVEREVAHVRAQLAQGEKLSALGSLVSGVAHELRTPLTYLANNAFLLEHRLTSAASDGRSASDALATVRPFLREIEGGVDRINLLVEDLRRYTKARQSTVLDVAPLEMFLAEAIELFRATNRGSHPVERSLSPTRPVRANRGAVQQLLLNLLQNAAEASAPGSTIRVVTRQEREHAVLDVVDHGVGIPEDVQQRMFEPLYTTKPEGTGLGLSIVRRIVGDHRATVRVASALGRGTTITVLFPTELPTE